MRDIWLASISPISRIVGHVLQCQIVISTINSKESERVSSRRIHATKSKTIKHFWRIKKLLETLPGMIA